MHHVARLSGSQLYDLVCLGILLTSTAALRAVRPGSIYYWLKDITSEFLKMSVLSTAFDMLDKVGIENREIRGREGSAQLRTGKAVFGLY